MSNLHSINNFAISEYIVKDFPEVIKLMEQYKNELIKYRTYKPVTEVLNSLDKNLYQCKLLLEHYKNVNVKKGIIE